MSLQSQVYILWPTLLALTGFAARCMGLDVRRAAGGMLLLALVPAGWTLPRQARLSLGWIGLLAILTCGLLLPVSRVSTLGDVSYSIYLWHWPLFVLYRTLTGSAEVGLLAGMAIIGLTILIARLTTRYVENLIRNPRRGKGNSVWAIGRGAGATAGVLVLSVAWGLMYVNAKRVDQAPIAQEDPRYPGARALEPGFRQAAVPNARLYPGPPAVRDDLPDVYSDDCQSSERGEDFSSWTYGRQGARTTIALVGGSHSAH